MDNLTDELGNELERTYVKHTYDNIANEFSGTRYKKWPKVEEFVNAQPRSSLLLDVGCGNGKYLNNNLAFSIGCDASEKLLTICKDKGFEVVLCDMTKMPFRENLFDAIICIAALHHVVTAQRRQRCLEEMIRLMISGSSKLLIQVWAFEQNLEKNNPYLKCHKTKSSSNDVQATKEAKVRLNNAVELSIHENRTPFAKQDLLVPFKIKPSCEASSNTETHVQHLRYYHVFKEGELNSMLEQVENIKLLDSYYDKGNWCSIALKD